MKKILMSLCLLFAMTTTSMACDPAQPNFQDELSTQQIGGTSALLGHFDKTGTKFVVTKTIGSSEISPGAYDLLSSDPCAGWPGPKNTSLMTETDESNPAIMRLIFASPLDGNGLLVSIGEVDSYLQNPKNQQYQIKYHLDEGTDEEGYQRITFIDFELSEKELISIILSQPDEARKRLEHIARTQGKKTSG